MRAIEAFEILKDLEGDEFEKKRKEILEDALENEIAPKNKQRLEQLLWKENASMVKIKNGLVRAEKANHTMWESAWELKETIDYGKKK